MAPANNADRNLLFGILALQIDFITRDELVGAMQAWVLDKAKSLGELLVERGNLPPARRNLLEALVGEHLNAHRGDARESLAAVVQVTPAARDLRALGDADLDFSIDAAEGNHCPDTTGPYLPQAPDDTAVLRYQRLRQHARGGLGEVFVALDQALHREVAIKEIQERHADDPASRNRFVREAEITGRLEHPGIVPVYDLGHHADGRPFYAMRFVRGQTLKEAILAFHAADVPGRESGERTLAFRQFLRRFVDACNAVAYAHSRGVLHRDIKPANILLGPYGETLVVDWGLAKPVGRQRSNVASVEESLRPAASNGLGETLAGTALGTPAYMSPEQASGRLDMLGLATDVYGLGATLYTLLTGRFPVEESDKDELLRRVQRGEITLPRRANPRTPRALEAICLKAMALRPEGRYADALSLAAEVEHWLADEPVQAFKEPLVTRGRRWVRRHQSMVGSAAAAALVVLVCLAAGIGIVTRAYQSEKEAREYAVEQEEEAHRQQLIAERRASEIEEYVLADQKASEQMLTLSISALPGESQEEKRTRVERQDYYLRLRRKVDAATGFTWNLGGKYLSIGDGLRRRGNHAAGVAWYEKARGVYEQLNSEHPEEPILAFELGELYLRMGLFHGELANARKAWECFDNAQAVADKKLAGGPIERLFIHDLTVYLNSAGNGLQLAKNAQAALAFHERALAACDKRLQRDPDDIRFLLDSADSHFRIGVARQALKLPKEAVAHFEKVSSMLEAASRKEPLSAEASKTLARSYHHAGLAWAALGNPAAALKQYEQAVVLRERLANPQARDYAFTSELSDDYQSIYFLHSNAGQHQLSRDWCERAAATFGRLAQDYPEKVEFAIIRESLLVLRVLAVAKGGRHEEAIRAAKELLASRKLSPVSHYNLACAFAVSVTHTRADASVTVQQKEQLTQSYTAEAIRLLVKSGVAAKLTDLKNDPDLQAIRSSAEFQRLVTSKERKSGDGGRGDVSAGR